MTQEAELRAPALGKAGDLGGESRQMAAEEWRPRKLSLESRITVDRRACAAAPTSVSIHSCETGEQGSTSASATENDCLGGEEQVLVMLPC